MQLFQQRKDTRAYKVGMETRTDLPDSERIEKTVFVKAPRSVKYGDVVKVIDAIKGAGANPVGLQVDDLPQ
jgi:biopolymer transport protein ExbD